MDPSVYSRVRSHCTLDGVRGSVEELRDKNLRAGWLTKDYRIVDGIYSG
jgi:hypothetical protein